MKKIRLLALYALLVAKRFLNPPQDKKTAFLALHQLRFNRRYAQIILQLGHSEYACFTYLSPRKFLTMDMYGEKIASLPGFRLAFRNDYRKCAVAITDKACIGSARHIRVRYDVFNENTGNDASSMFYPILLHPNILNERNEKDALAHFENNLDAPRRITCLFAGNVNPESYDNPRTREYFHIHTRHEIYSWIRDSLDERLVFEPKSMVELTDAIKNGQTVGRVVLVDSSRFEIPQNRLFDFFSITDFFIHMPGFIQPFCHNQIESMAAGAVPVTQFPGIFRPPFIDGDNAVVYRTLPELSATLARICSHEMPDERIRSMRKSINRYYAERLSLDSFRRKMNDFMQDANRHSIDYYICASEDSMI